MTSASLPLQCGQAGLDRGLLRRGGWRVLLLLEATQHAEGVLVDRSLCGPAAERIPQLPVDRHVRSLRLELLFEPPAHLSRTHAEPALPVKLGSLPVWRTEELERLLPRLE